jgi:hypothetical protein
MAVNDVHGILIIVGMLYLVVIINIIKKRPTYPGIKYPKTQLLNLHILIFNRFFKLFILYIIRIILTLKSTRTYRYLFIIVPTSS